MKSRILGLDMPSAYTQLVGIQRIIVLGSNVPHYRNFDTKFDKHVDNSLRCDLATHPLLAR